MIVVAFVAPASAQDAMPPLFADLPKLAKTWPPAWAALIADIVPARPDFEKDVLVKLDALLRTDKPSTESYRRAELVLTATLRHHESVRRAAPLADHPSQAMQTELQDRLATLRKDWLKHLGDSAQALALADAWLPVTAQDSPLRPAILRLWIDRAKDAIEKKDYTTARTLLFRSETNFDGAAAVPIRQPLRDRAESLFKEAQTLPDAQAIRLLEETLQLWRRLPDARDTLERRKGTYRTLFVGVRALPEQLSPATVCTVAEKQALDLLFDRLYRAEKHRYAPQLAAALPGQAIPLRRDVYWSSGERVTAADLRHTALLTNPILWRDFLEMPRVENPFLVDIKYRQGLLEPLAPLTFHVLPQLVRGKQLDRADDPEFSKTPVGSGPFQYVGRKVDAGKIYAVFQANPHDLRGEPRSLREIRMIAWSDPKKDLVKPLPQLIFDAPTDQLPALRDLGYAEVRIVDYSHLHLLAVNHRQPSLASVAVRRAIAHGIDRQTLLSRHFRGVAAKEKYHATANSLFPRNSWAACPAPRVPAELYQPEQARLYAQQAKKNLGNPTWTLKYPAGDPHIQKACADIAQSIRGLFPDASVRLEALAPRDLRIALEERHFDLLYHTAEDLDDPLRLAALFDAQESATRPGGANYLGYNNDVRLQELLAAALKYRQFSSAQANMHAVDAHLYETMPAIPLWQLDLHVLIQPTLRLPPIDGSSVFSGVRGWKF